MGRSWNDKRSWKKFGGRPDKGQKNRNNNHRQVTHDEQVTEFDQSWKEYTGRDEFDNQRN